VDEDDAAAAFDKLLLPELDELEVSIAALLYEP
jgi:hypothetical protein